MDIQAATPPPPPPPPPPFSGNNRGSSLPHWQPVYSSIDEIGENSGASPPSTPPIVGSA
ncbi:hypothetical protein A2U01_0100572, partial [Trifolium medium]|nr:hypothetical protein [Trifolium medium]